MDATELARWTRFAAKGGIGKCSAAQDCVAESPEDLMFLQGDEITVLMQLNDPEGMYLGYCEGVVGRFHGAHVRFHGKLKKPVMTRRSLTATAKSPTPTVIQSPSPMSMLAGSRRSSLARSSRPSTATTDDEATVSHSMSHSSSSTVSDSVIVTPPLQQTSQYSPSQSPSQLLSPSFLNTNTTLPLMISPKKLQFSPQPSPQLATFSLPPPRRQASSPTPQPAKIERALTPPPAALTPPPIAAQPSRSRLPPPASPPLSVTRRSPSPPESLLYSSPSPDHDNRLSEAMSEGDVGMGLSGIGLSLLQGGDDGDDWSSTSSRYSVRSMARSPDSDDMNTEENSTETAHGDSTFGISTFPVAPSSSSDPPSVAPSQLTEPLSPVKHSFDNDSESLPNPRRQSFAHSIAPSLAPSASTKHSDDVWDIYDDYRYSRYSLASRASRFSQLSHPASASASASDVPPMPQRTRSIDSDVSIYSNNASPADPRRASVNSDASVYSTNIVSPPSPTHSVASDASVYAQEGTSLSVDTDAANKLLNVEGQQERNQKRPTTLDFDHRSPLLHTRWASPASSPTTSANGSVLSPSYSMTSFSSGAASAIRQRLEDDKSSPVAQNAVLEEDEQTQETQTRDKKVSREFGRDIVVEDDEEIPVHARQSTAQDPEEGSDSSRSSSPTPPPTAAPSELEQSYPSTDLAPLPPSASTTSPPPTHVPRPSLSELRGYASDTSPGGQRQSLFLPHPNAPKPTAASAGPMYIRDPVREQSQQMQPRPTHPGAIAANVLNMALHHQQYRPYGLTIYGRVEADLGSSSGPVPILFSVDPPRLPPPPPRQLTASPAVGAVAPPRIGTPLNDKSASSESVSGKAGVIPRANFFPKAGTTRPRSRSFSGFNNSPASPTGQQSREEGGKPLERPQEPASTLGMPVPPSASLPALKKPSSMSKLRTAHAPSPLSLPSNNRVVGSPLKTPLAGTGFIQSPVLPSPAMATGSSSFGVRHIHSMTTLNESPSAQQSGPIRPTITTRNTGPSSPPPSSSTSTSPSRLRKQLSMQSVTTSRHSRDPTTDSSVSAPWPRPSVESERTSFSSIRSQVVSPAPGQRQPSLRTKLSLPNIRRSQNRQDSVSSLPTTDGETVQVKDTDFELVRPTIPQVQSQRSSEDSVALGGQSDYTKPDFGANFLRADSAMSMSSSNPPRSPTVSDISGPGGVQKNHKATESEASIDAHRHREQKWVSLMSSVPASQAKKNKKMRKLVFEGVPSSVRYQVWSHLMDSKVRKVAGVYVQLGKRGRVSAFGDIERDVKRCFADHPQLLSTQGPLLSLLQAYLTMVPDLQYNTGLTLIAGHLLLLSPEEDAFWLFVSLMDTYLRPFFSSNTTQLEVDSALFSKALEVNDTQVFKKLLIDMSINPSKICHPWFCSLFAGIVPNDYLNRTWDIFLVEGIPFLIRVGLAVIYCCRRAILECKSEEAALELLKRPSPTWFPPSSDGFISLVSSMKLKDDEVRKQRVKMEAQVKRQAQNPRTLTNTSASISLPQS